MCDVKSSESFSYNLATVHPSKRSAATAQRVLDHCPCIASIQPSYLPSRWYCVLFRSQHIIEPFSSGFRITIQTSPVLVMKYPTPIHALRVYSSCYKLDAHSETKNPIPKPYTVNLCITIFS